MRLSLLRSHVVLLFLLAAQPLRGSESQVGLDLLPADLARQVYGYIQVNDPRWLVDRTTDLVAGMQFDITEANTWVAENLFGSANLQGLDLSQPALFAWRRGGRGSLLAVIPLAGREVFLRHFGLVRNESRFLVKVGERDGTYVFSQVSSEGPLEYRMLVRDNYAYLARTVEECQSMADRPLPVALMREQEPLIMATSGTSLAGTLSITDPELTLAMSLLPEALRTLQGRLIGLLEQIAQIRVAFTQDKEEVLQADATISFQADSDLAVWSARQTNSASRLLPVIERGGELITLYGHLRWKGEMEALARHLVEACRQSLGDKFSGEAEADLRNFFRLSDNAEAFAAAVNLEIDRPDPDRPLILFSSSQRSVMDQPRASDYVHVLRSFDQVFLPPSMVGEYGAQAGLLTYAKPTADGGRAVALADRNWLLNVSVPTQARAEQELTGMLERLQTTNAPIGEAAIVAIRLHLHNLARQIARASLRNLPETLENTDLSLALKSLGKDGVLLEARLPAQRAGLLLGRAGISQYHALLPAPAQLGAPR